MKWVAIAAVLASSLVVTVPQAQAKGCVKGAILGGIAGHFAGHHGMMGAAAGCAVGHHYANKPSKTGPNDPTAPNTPPAQQ